MNLQWQLLLYFKCQVYVQVGHLLIKYGNVITFLQSFSSLQFLAFLFNEGNITTWMKDEVTLYFLLI